MEDFHTILVRETRESLAPPTDGLRDWGPLISEDPRGAAAPTPWERPVVV